MGFSDQVRSGAGQHAFSRSVGIGKAPIASSTTKPSLMLVRIDLRALLRHLRLKA